MTEILSTFVFWGGAVAVVIAAISTALFLFVRNPTLAMGGDFLGMFDTQRTLYISGVKGGGKTLLSVFLSSLLYAQGKVKFIHANIPSVIVEPVSIPLQDCVFIVDECQEFVSNAKDAKEAEAYIRKFRIKFIMAGVGAPNRIFTKLKAWRVWNGYKFFIPVWVYKWRWEGIREVEQGWFVLLRPDLVYFFYDTEVTPPDDGGLFDALSKTAEMHKQIEREAIEDESDHTDQQAEDSHRAENVSSIRGLEEAEAIEEAIADAAESFSDTATKIETAAERLSKTLNRRRH